MDYPVIDPVRTGSNIRTLIRNSGNTITGVGRLLGLADMSTMYKWLRGEALPGILDCSYCIVPMICIRKCSVMRNRMISWPARRI